MVIGGEKPATKYGITVTADSFNTTSPQYMRSDLAGAASSSYHATAKVFGRDSYDGDAAGSEAPIPAFYEWAASLANIDAASVQATARVGGCTALDFQPNRPGWLRCWQADLTDFHRPISAHKLTDLSLKRAGRAPAWPYRHLTAHG